MSDRIEFYKNRSIGDRFSIAIDFLKQNWKVLYKNICYGGLPLALLMGYLLARQQSFVSLGQSLDVSSSVANIFLNMAFLYIVIFINLIYVYSMTGAVLLHYDRNQLTESSNWNDLQTTFFRFAGKTFLTMLIVFIPIGVIFTVIGAIFGFSAFAFSSSGMSALPAIGIVLFVLILFGALVALLPSFSILYFPAYFSEKNVWEGVKTSFSLGFKNWGSLFVALILTSIIYIIVSVIFSGPLQLVSLFSVFAGMNISFVVYLLLGILSAIGILLTYPLMVLIYAFQYFSIVEREEGVSLKSQVSDFENL
jgi:hypothetical protein